MKTITLAPGERLRAGQLIRKGVLPDAVVASARSIVADVRERGDDALRGYSKQFDGVELEGLRLPQEALERALELVSPSFRAALEKAAAQIRAFHEREIGRAHEERQ